MRASVCLFLALSAALPLWSQVEPSARGGAQPVEDDTYMIVPSAVSGALFPAGSAPGERSNYLTGGLTFEAAYNNNVLPGATSQPLEDTTYSIWPSLSLELKTPRSIRSLAYSSGYTFYQKTSVLNAINQNASADFQYHLSTRAVVSLSDTFQQNSNLFNQPFLVSGGQGTGTQGAQNAVVIAPYANRTTNDTVGTFSYQYSLNGMFGGGGTFRILNYPDLNQNQGLYNSKSGSGLGFYTRRILKGQYIGAEYEYSRITTTPAISTTTLDTLVAFYTRTAERGLNLSLSGGGQYLDFVQTSPLHFHQWEPSGKATIGWQTDRARLEAEYDRVEEAGQGLLGVFTSNQGNASVLWRMTRTWDLNASAGYSIYKEVLPSQLVSLQGGHTVLGTISLRHQFNEQLGVQGGYTRLHQSYESVPAASSSPDSDRVFVSITYQFNRPLGR